MDSRSNADQRRGRALHILLGYNLPWLLWTVYAALRTGLPSSWSWTCPMHALLGWCPGCGLTRAYTALLTDGRLLTPWLLVVLGLFAASAVSSIVAARRVWRAPPAVT